MSFKIRRNDPCPCGSGRKYKHCCLWGPAVDKRCAAEVHYGEGIELQARGRLPEAAARFRAAIALRPDFVEAHVNLGNVLQDQGQFDQALACFRRALQVRPEFAEVHLNIGLSLQALTRIDEAIASYRCAVAQPGVSAQAHTNLGMALREAGRLEEAVSSLRAALAIDPGCVETLHGLGMAQLAQGRVAEAIAVLRRTLALDPTLAVHSALLLALQYPDSECPAEVRKEHRRFADHFETPLAPAIAAHTNGRDPERRLRVGYVSADFRSHSVAYFIEPVLANHDRSQFEITCYYNNAAREDPVTVRLRAMADHWLQCSGHSDQQLAERICADRIDVLVDLSGHTAGNRLLVFARRPAPVQISWIGYPSTTGLRQIDYRLTDQWVSPPDARSASDSDKDTEPLYWLPDIFSCYRPSQDAPAVKAPPALENGWVTLGSFNNVAKISERVVQVWSRLLLARPSLRLVLKDRCFADESARAWMTERFAAHGFETARLTLLARAPSDGEHLGLYGRVDIALDTFPYCGTTTTCEALWMGVPVVSLAGNAFAARVGSTLLRAVGHPDWVATSESDYVDRVLALAADPSRLNDVRMKLRDQVRSSPLCQEASFTRQLEAAYRAMWRQWCALQKEPNFA